MTKSANQTRECLQRRGEENTRNCQTNPNKESIFFVKEQRILL